MKRIRKYLLALIALIILILSLTVWFNFIVQNSSEPFITDNLKDLSDFKVGLLLGTSKSLKNGNPNDFFYYRIQAAVELFESGKIKYILISGDNGTSYYNEPLDMKTELMKQGIPENVIYPDYAGFRTYDSVVRAKEIFGQSRFVVISQKFHNERAVYIARKLGIEAFGYNAKDAVEQEGFKTKAREFFARAKVYVDLAFGIQPKFLGEKIHIG
ncbi:MAG: YdcF family protein [Ignavibacteria bacterium]|nr:YdcF family protein [Ignavibacteria bacterium]